MKRPNRSSSLISIGSPKTIFPKVNDTDVFADGRWHIYPSLTPTMTPTTTPSVTPSQSAMVSPSATPSVTPSVTPSLTPSITPSITLTPSITPSITPSGPTLLCQNTIFQSLFNGINGGTVFSDDKGHTITAHGAITTTTTQSKFNGSSLFLNNPEINYLTVDGMGTEIDFGTGDYTIEGWVNYTNLQQKEIIGCSTWVLSTNWSIGDERLWFWSTPTGYKQSSGSFAYAWHHVAIVRYGTTWNMYVDGTSRVSATGISTSMGASDGILKIGKGFSGYMNDWRIVKGVAIYTANFTAPATPFPDC